MSNLYICTTCFGLTAKGNGMQRCSCQEVKSYPGVDCPSGYHLCYLCAALVTGGESRYSWNACNWCLKFNRWLRENHGISLPLGRHSIMNGIAIPFKSGEGEKKVAVEKMLDFLTLSTKLEQWGQIQAKSLFSSVLSWKKERYILASKWEAKFALSKVMATKRSAGAVGDFLKTT
jgi:hypothetical protein